MVNEKQILIENEKKANKNLIVVMIIAYAILLADSLYTVSEYYSHSHKLIYNVGFAIAGIAIIISIIINNKLPDKYFKYKKYFLAVSFLIVVGSYSLLYVQTIFVFPPILLGVFSRFYDKKFMRIMTILTSIVIVLYTLGSIGLGVVKDVNVVPLLPGTILRIPDNSIWIIDALDELDISNIDYVKNYIIYMIVPFAAIYGSYVFIFNGLSKSGNEIFDKRIEQEKHNAYIEKELSIASGIQNSMLPQNFDSFGGHELVDIYACMYPARRVGGDFYDFFMLDEDKICFLVGDVSGKDVPAALFMAETQTLIKSMAVLGLSTSEIMAKSNNALNEKNTMKFFVSVWLGILDTKTGILNYTNAGHNPPLLYRKSSGEYKKLICKPNLVLAMLPDMEYEQECIQFSRGDRIFIYTDGVTDAMNADNKCYGEERLCKYLNTNIQENGQNVLEGIRQDILEYTSEVEQFDDLTMLVLELLKR